MKTIMFYISVYIAVLLLPTAVVVCDISCQTGNYHVICKFNRDIEAEKLNFIVWIFPFGTTEFSATNGKQALACNWDDREHVYKCRLKSGYTFDDKVRSGHVSVDMVNISKTHEGIYKCQLVTEESIPSSTCNFTLKAQATGTTTLSPANRRKTISCTGGVFTKCESAKITCYFNLDIKQHRRNFNVVHYPHKQGAFSSDAGNYVLVCNWGEGESLECKVEDGYTFDKQDLVSDTLTLLIPDVKTSVAGVYVCQIVPDGGVPLETCKLDVQGVSAPAAGGSCPTKTCPDSECEKSTLFIVWSAVSSIIIIVLSVLVTFLSCFFRLHYRIRRMTSGSDENPVAQCSGFAVLARQPDNARHATYKVVATEDEAPVKLEMTGPNTHPPSMNSMLKEELSDSWTPEEVGQWLREKGFEQYVELFQQVNGARLLAFYYRIELWKFGMGSCCDGYDRQRLLGHIERLRAIVARRKWREKR